MAGRYKPYPEYKDSGIEWLGEIPAHWPISPLKYLCSFSGGGTPSKDKPEYWSGDIPWVSPKDMKSSRITSTIDNVTELAVKQSSTSLVGSGALLMVVRSGILQHSIPVAINDVPVTLNQDMKALRLNSRLNVKYLMYFISGNQAQLLLEWSKQGATVESIEQEYLANTIFPAAPIHEQNKVAAFLDHETAKIDTLIEKQQQLIQLLKEKRQAVISHAVTKGLSSLSGGSNAKLRDSGVEWLGEVPEHWEVTRAKYLFDFVTSGSRGWADFYSDEGSLFFRITNLTRDTIEPKMESVQSVTPPLGSEGERSRINKDDLLISITADLGSVCVANDEVIGGYVSQHVALCRPNESVESSRWLGYFILSDIAKEQFIGSAYGGTKIQLSLEDIRELWIVKPRCEDQIEVALYIDEQLTKFAKIIDFAESQIILLKERRTALISAAVTGKIDVRDWVAPPASPTHKEVAA
jgi:type I restriction enzyme S subunit